MNNSDYREKIINRTYSFSLSVIQLIRKYSSNDFVFQVISKQLIRSATSIGANVVEAQACSTKKDFTNFIHHSLKSSNETRYWLGLLRDSYPNTKEVILPILKEAQELSKMLGSTVRTLKKPKTSN
jgi:four helix bundle protein